jgi:hypothetical protein
VLSDSNPRGLGDPNPSLTRAIGYLIIPVDYGPVWGLGLGLGDACRVKASLGFGEQRTVSLLRS